MPMFLKLRIQKTLQINLEKGKRKKEKRTDGKMTREETSFDPDSRTSGVAPSIRVTKGLQPLKEGLKWLKQLFPSVILPLSFDKNQIVL